VEQLALEGFAIIEIYKLGMAHIKEAVAESCLDVLAILSKSSVLYRISAAQSKTMIMVSARFTVLGLTIRSQV
jgi:hypothetical protein